MNPQHWIDRFKANRTGWREPDWDQPCEIENTQRRKLLAVSLATFQLGETGGGSRLMRYVAKSGAIRERERGRYSEAMTLFIAEENRHAELLARAVHHLGGELRQRHWTNTAFRLIRSALGVEFNLQTLLIAELIAEAYYGILARRVTDRAVCELCRKIVRDEVAHIAFHRDFFRQQHRSRLPFVTALWSLQFQLLFCVAEKIVWMDHGRCLGAFGVRGSEFRRRTRRCCRRFLESALHPAPGNGPVHGDAPAGREENEFAAT